MEWFTVKEKRREIMIKVPANMRVADKKLQACFFQGQEVRLLQMTICWPVCLIPSGRVGLEICARAQKDSARLGLISAALAWRSHNISSSIPCLTALSASGTSLTKFLTPHTPQRCYTGLEFIFEKGMRESQSCRKKSTT